MPWWTVKLSYLMSQGNDLFLFIYRLDWDNVVTPASAIENINFPLCRFWPVMLECTWLIFECSCPATFHWCIHKGITLRKSRGTNATFICWSFHESPASIEWIIRIKIGIACSYLPFTVEEKLPELPLTSFTFWQFALENFSLPVFPTTNLFTTTKNWFLTWIGHVGYRTILCSTVYRTQYHSLLKIVFPSSHNHCDRLFQAILGLHPSYNIPRPYKRGKRAISPLYIWFC